MTRRIRRVRKTATKKIGWCSILGIIWMGCNSINAVQSDSSDDDLSIFSIRRQQWIEQWTPDP